MLTHKREGAGYSLARHPQAELSFKEVNSLYDLARLRALGISAEEVQIQRFVYTIPAGGTTTKTFTTTIDQLRVIGGYAELKNLDADYDIDIGKTGDTDCFISDFNSGAYADATKKLALDPTYLQDGDDVIVTIASNSNTGALTLEVVLLCDHMLQFKPSVTIDATRVLTKLDSGTTFHISGGSARTITLPALQEGLNFKFIVDTNNPTGDITISGATALKIYGNLWVFSTTDESNRVACVGKTSVLIDTTALKGDHLEFICDGSFWYVSGMSGVQGGFTTA